MGPAYRALRIYLLPFLCIQVCAIGFVVGYYYYPPIKTVCAEIARWKSEREILFSIIAGAISGGIIPEIAKIATGRFGSFSLQKLGEILYLIFVFGAFGILVNYLYHFQTFAFGSGIDLMTVALKVFVDQFIANPVIATPFILILCLWKEKNFSLQETLQAWNWHLYAERVVPILIPSWFYWVPMVSCIYALPGDLQVPFWGCVVSAWNIILIFIIDDTAGATPPAPEALQAPCAPSLPE